jgi:hypothetical protein
MTLDEVVLGAPLDRLHGERLIVSAAQDHDRHLGGNRLRGAEGGQAARVGKGEIEKDAVGHRVAKVRLRR